MYRCMKWIFMLLALSLVAFGSTPAQAQDPEQLAPCARFGYSTEEDFITRGPTPPDGNVIISDGDLISRDGQVCLRNYELLAPWGIEEDLGLDAVDVIDVERGLVIFSTELDDPEGRFDAGDLLATNGAIVPNEALLKLFQVQQNLELDALHFVAEDDLQILNFLDVAASIDDPMEWADNRPLAAWLTRYEIDIWFSTEGSERVASTVPIYDGDLLSARNGIIVLQQDQLLPAAVPAGIPNRGVDFGLDAATSTRRPNREQVRFSTEILYRGEQAFTDGDVLRQGAGVEIQHAPIIAPLEPPADFLGLDALHLNLQRDDGSDEGSNPDTFDSERSDMTFLPLISDQQPVQAAGGE